MHYLCIITATVWLVGSCLLALIETPVMRRYHWRLLFWLVLLMPFAIYRISVSRWLGTC